MPASLLSPVLLACCVVELHWHNTAISLNEKQVEKHHRHQSKCPQVRIGRVRVVHMEALVALPVVPLWPLDLCLMLADLIIGSGLPCVPVLVSPDPTASKEHHALSPRYS